MTKVKESSLHSVPLVVFNMEEGEEGWGVWRLMVCFQESKSTLSLRLLTLFPPSFLPYQFRVERPSKPYLFFNLSLHKPVAFQHLQYTSAVHSPASRNFHQEFLLSTTFAKNFSFLQLFLLSTLEVSVANEVLHHSAVASVLCNTGPRHYITYRLITALKYYVPSRCSHHVY